MIAAGRKWGENRTWATEYRGLIAIHAGKGSQYLTAAERRRYPTGCVIAAAKLTAVVHVDKVRDVARSKRGKCRVARGCSRFWTEVERHAFTEGPFCWVLEDVQLLNPVPWRGALGLWELPPVRLVAVVASSATLGPLWTCGDTSPVG